MYFPILLMKEQRDLQDTACRVSSSNNPILGRVIQQHSSSKNVSVSWDSLSGSSCEFNQKSSLPSAINSMIDKESFP